MIHLISDTSLVHVIRPPLPTVRRVIISGGTERQTKLAGKVQIRVGHPGDIWLLVVYRLPVSIARGFW